MFYDNLKEICEKKKTSPSAVCLALGMSKSNVTEWKNGSSPKLDTVIKIANHLSINPARLIPKEQKAAAISPTDDLLQPNGAGDRDKA